MHVTILDDDGGALPAAVSCASVALADASILMYGLVAACNCAALGDATALDCTSAELGAASAGLTLACMPALDRVTYLREFGAVGFGKLTASMQLALQGCAALHAQMRAALESSLEKRAAKEAKASKKRAHAEAAPDAEREAEK